MAVASGVEQWYGGPGRAEPPGPPWPTTHQSAVRPVNDLVRSGAVRGRCWADRPIHGYPGRGIRRVRAGPHDTRMHITAATVPNRGGRDSVMGGTVVGGLLVLGGLWLAYVAWSTPVLAAIASAIRPGAGTPGLPMLAVALALPATFVVVGTNRLARTVAAIRGTLHGRGDRLSGILPADVVLSRGLILDDDRPAPTLLVGAFGLAAVQESRVVTADDMLTATRDAERVRRWLNQNDQDFVVRVHTAVIGPAGTVDRTAGCALITVEQVPVWLASLPRQRSLSDARLARLVKLVTPPG